MKDWLGHAAILWLIAAAILGGTELLLPGLFLVFLALAAAIVGVITLFLPGLSLAGQLIGFIAWAVVTVLIGRRWYHEYPVASADPMLNDRIARLIGQTVTVTQEIHGGSGRVRVGDGEWTAHGPDAPVGSKMRVTGGHAGALAVEPITQIEGRGLLPEGPSG